MLLLSAYTTGFYEAQSGNSRLVSARAVVREVLRVAGTPSSVLDVGCGVGTLLAEAQDLGVSEIVGMDGDYVDRT